MAVTVRKVLGDRVLIKRDLPPKKVGMIELAQETVQKERIGTAVGTVMEIGPLCWKSAEMRDVQVTKPDGSVVTERQGEPWCKVGDKVLYQRYSGMRIPDPMAPDGYVEDLIFILYSDLVCTLEDTNAE